MVTRDQRQSISNLAARAFNAERAHETVRICSARLSAIRVEVGLDFEAFHLSSPALLSPILFYTVTISFEYVVVTVATAAARYRQVPHRLTPESETAVALQVRQV